MGRRCQRVAVRTRQTASTATTPVRGDPGRARGPTGVVVRFGTLVVAAALARRAGLLPPGSRPDEQQGKQPRSLMPALSPRTRPCGQSGPATRERAVPVLLRDVLVRTPRARLKDRQRRSADDRECPLKREKRQRLAAVTRSAIIRPACSHGTGRPDPLFQDGGSQPIRVDAVLIPYATTAAFKAVGLRRPR